VLVKIGQKVRRQTIKLLSNGLKRDGWKDKQKIMAWAQGGQIYRLISDTLDYNLSLHQYLTGLASSRVKWSYVHTEIQHHVEEMSLIRSTSDSRIQALVFLYCYLRDAHAVGWQSTTLQAQRNVELFAQECNPEESDCEPTNTECTNMSLLTCQKCGTALHSGGMRSCPWGNLSNKKAKAAAAKFMRGGIVIPDQAEKEG
jgi:hypothetical protein